MLRRLPPFLKISARWYSFYSFTGKETGGDGATGGEDPYLVLGVKRTDSVEDIRRAYRLAAKKNHPDTLRAQGLPTEMVDRATERMARINAAWDAIKRERGA